MRDQLELKSVKNIQVFSSFANFYKKLIKNFIFQITDRFAGNNSLNIKTNNNKKNHNVLGSIDDSADGGSINENI